MPHALAIPAASGPKSVRRPVIWHLLTPEYPPTLGGVADYAHQVAEGLRAAGDAVEVWGPARLPGGFNSGSLRSLRAALRRDGPDCRLLVQWVPHGFGCRSLNVGFCWWVLWTAWREAVRVELMVHEPGLGWAGGSWKHRLAAVVHRLMLILLLQAATRVWMSIPGWEPSLRPFTLGRPVPLHWLPIPSSILPVHNPTAVAELRQRYASGAQVLAGHFSTHGRTITEILDRTVPALLRAQDNTVLLLVGVGSQEYCAALLSREPGLAGRVAATGPIAAEQVSLYLQACDLLLQPYPDGISTRRTSTMSPLAHGRTVVTTLGALTEEFWAASGAVAAVPIHNDEALIQTTADLLADAPRRAAIGAQAARLYEDRFALRHTVEQLRRS